jgi:hypothetical protein
VQNTLKSKHWTSDRRKARDFLPAAVFLLVFNDDPVVTAEIHTKRSNYQRLFVDKTRS